MWGDTRATVADRGIFGAFRDEGDRGGTTTEEAAHDGQTTVLPDTSGANGEIDGGRDCFVLGQYQFWNVIPGVGVCRGVAECGEGEGK